MRKKKSRMPLLMGGIFIFIMISSVFAIMFGGYTQNSRTVKYGGLTFSSLENGMWRTKIDGRNIDFDYPPDVLTYIEIDPQAAASLKSAPQIDFTYNYSSEAAQEIALIQFQLETYYLSHRFIRTGSISENEWGKDIITCADATPAVPVLYFRLGDETRIISEGNCIIAEAGRIQDVFALKDRIVYSIYGVIV